MNVYFGENFWGTGEPGTEMEKILVGQEFDREGLSGYIPAVYVNEEGLVIDLCIRIPGKIVQDFWDRWHRRLENGLDAREREQFMRENPLDVDLDLEISVNGRQLEKEFGCGAGYTRIFGDQIRGSLEEQLFLEYGCDEKDGWQFKRFACRWGENMFSHERMRSYESMISSMEVRFVAYDRPYGCDPMRIAVEDVGKRSVLLHPVSGRSYTLFVDKVEQQELSADVLKSVRRQSGCRHLEYPSHYLAVAYHTEPALPAGAFCLQDVGEGDAPRGVGQGHAAGISIIGGADGPTSVFLAGKTDTKEGGIVMSGLHFQPIDCGWFQPFFMVKERDDMTLTVAF